MNSLHRRGHPTPAPLMSSRLSKLPLKYFSSVSTEMQAAPPASYSSAMSTGSKSSLMIPLEGEARLHSAMSPGFPVSSYLALIAPMKSRAGCTNPIFLLSDARSIFSLWRAISSFLNHTISSKMFLGFSSSSAGISNCSRLPALCLSLPPGGYRLMVTSLWALLLLAMTAFLLPAGCTEDPDLAPAGTPRLDRFALKVPGLILAPNLTPALSRCPRDLQALLGSSRAGLFSSPPI
mmetsp:Transcript_4994/g.17987  ORF Transcript_4994/g.17987 Transcript_4994/m.17987 type:complete len:235 (-) Transcript_4994:9-713(-)